MIVYLGICAIFIKKIGNLESTFPALDDTAVPGDLDHQRG
jgi:hypothetical protein